jgi:hypothetical protein
VSRALAAALAAAAALQASPAPVPAPKPSVVMIISARLSPGGTYAAESAGTGFFADSSGTVLTAAHIVARAEADPAIRAVFAAVWEGGRRVLYAARIECATPLPFSPLSPPPPGTPFTRDMALLRLAPPPPSVRMWRWRLPGGETRGTAVAAASPPKGIPPLIPAPSASPHEWVSVPGHGRVRGHPGLLWTDHGTVTGTAELADGTRALAIRMAIGPDAGQSGSPVVDPWGRLIGMLTWKAGGARHVGVAQAVTRDALVQVSSLCRALRVY